MNLLILQLLASLLALMNNQAIPVETKIEVYNKTIPVIEKYMKETNEDKVMEDGVVEEKVEEVKQPEEKKGFKFVPGTGTSSA